MGTQLVMIWKIMKKRCAVRWHPNLTIGVLLYLLLRGKEKKNQSGGINKNDPKNEKILAPLQ